MLSNMQQNPTASTSQFKRAVQIIQTGMKHQTSPQNKRVMNLNVKPPNATRLSQGRAEPLPDQIMKPSLFTSVLQSSPTRQHYLRKQQHDY